MSNYVLGLGLNARAIPMEYAVVCLKSLNPRYEYLQTEAKLVSSVDEARKVCETYHNAFNDQDINTIHSVMHFPHIRINDQGIVRILQTVEESTIGHQRYFQRITDQDNWSHSSQDVVEVLHASDVKVHLKIQFTRYRTDGTQIATYQSLWIVVKQGGQWGIIARSSFAP